MQHGNHLKHMLIAGGLILVGLLAFGVPTGSALRSAAVLACPLGMIAMMFMMRGGHGHAGGNIGADPQHAPADAPVDLRSPTGHQHH
jgi:hypothetical protein